MTHVLILYLRYLAHTRRAATILLRIIGMRRENNCKRKQPVLLPGEAAPAHLLQEDDDSWDQVGPRLLQLKQGGRRPGCERDHDPGDPGDVCHSPDEHLRLAKGDILEELAILEQHPAH